MSDLKPCAFCGSKPVEFMISKHKPRVSCYNGNCKLSRQDFTPYSWNRRPYEDKAKANAIRDFINKHCGTGRIHRWLMQTLESEITSSGEQSANKQQLNDKSPIVVNGGSITSGTGVKS